MNIKYGNKCEIKDFRCWSGCAGFQLKLHVVLKLVTDRRTELYCGSEKSRKPLKMICFSLLSRASADVCWSLRDSSQTFCPALSCKTTPPDSTCKVSGQQWETSGQYVLDLLLCSRHQLHPHWKVNVVLGHLLNFCCFTCWETDLINVPVRCFVITESQVVERRVTGYLQAYADLKKRHTRQQYCKTIGQDAGIYKMVQI